MGAIVLKNLQIVIFRLVYFNYLILFLFVFLFIIFIYLLFILFYYIFYYIKCFNLTPLPLLLYI